MQEVDVMSCGYGYIPKLIMKDPTISLEAKAIYAYLASYAGKDKKAYPTISRMLIELPSGRARFFKFRKELIDKGYLIVHKMRNGNRNANNVYELADKIKIEVLEDVEEIEVPKEIEELKEIKVEKPKEIKKSTAEEVKEVKTKKSSKKAEEDNKKVQEVVDMYHEICTSMSKVRAINPKRKRAVLISLKKYGLEELRKIFEYAQKNSFLSGQDTGWSADFEWLINENNIVKVLEGKYEKPFKKNNNQNNYQGYQNYQNTQIEITPSNTPNTTNRFNRFGQRNYTKEELEEIEMRLLNRQ